MLAAREVPSGDAHAESAAIAPSPSALVLWVSLSAGLVLAGLTPPFQVPDEPNHFFRAYQIADGALVAQKLHESVGGAIPRSLPAVASNVIGQVPFHPDVKPNRTVWAAAFDTPLHQDDRIEVAFANTALTGPIGYLPQVLGIELAKIIGASTLTMFYVARFVTMLLCAVVTALAIRIMPVRPWTCVFLSLLPMTLFVRSSVSSDAPTLALALLAVVICARLAARIPGSTSPTDAWPLYLVAALLALGKPPYVGVALLGLAIPRRVFRNARAHAATLFMLVTVATTFQVTWLVALRGKAATWAPGSDPDTQLALIAQDPLATAGLLVWDLAASAPVLLHQMIGVLGWLDAPLVTPVVVLLGLTILIVALSEAPFAAAHMRWIAAAIGIGGILALQALNYVYWTAPGSVHVAGLQGRHLTPFVTLLLLSLPVPPGISHSVSLVRCQLIIVFVVVTTVATALTVLRRYYLDF